MKKLLLTFLLISVTSPVYAYIDNVPQTMAAMAFYDTNNQRIACDVMSDLVLYCINEDESPYSGAATAKSKTDDPQITAELKISNGKPNGPFKLFEGKDLSVEGFFVYGLLEGIETKYHPNGKTFLLTGYLHGKKHGVAQEYDENGTLIGTVSWKNGQQNGEMRENYPNGNLKSLSAWKDNRQHGISTFYGEDGRVTERSLWFKGKLIKSTAD